LNISIVIPVYNGESSIVGLFDELRKHLKGRLFQVVLVNDCSPDNSHQVCLSLQKDNPEIITYVELARNFGEHSAVLAGLHQVKGDCAIIMDDDFQNPPHTVLSLVNKMEASEADVVYSYYQKKKHHWFRNLGSQFNDFVACALLKKPKDLYLSSFKCINRFLIDEIIKYDGPYPYLDGLVLRSTKRIAKVEVDHADRGEGESGYTLKKLVRLWLNMFINFSVLPLRMCTYLGLVINLGALVFSLITFYEKSVNPSMPLGWASLMIAVMLFSGVQLLMLGLIGEYVGSLFMTINKTPQFIVRQSWDKN
jgi:glycosyltransferase involved in cell wall biosynthesis